MLRIVQGFAKNGAKDSQTRMLDAFLSSVLIEVVAENYRYLMHEMAFSAKDQVVDPPLRANERVLSGLFATAISRVSPRSRPEVRINRLVEDDDSLDEAEDSDMESENEYSAGRVDYLAWYGEHTIATELKVAPANIDNATATQLMQKRWKKVNAQAESAQGFLRQSDRYYQPSAIALMVIIGRRAVTNISSVKNREETFDKDIESFNMLLTNNLKPQLHVNYIVPHEFRASTRKRKGQIVHGVVYTPVISFIANRYI